MVNQVGRKEMVKMLKQAGPAICTRSGNGKTVNCAKMARRQARESENLPIYRYRWGNLWIYQSILSIRLSIQQCINLSIYHSINISPNQSINLTTYQFSNLLSYQSINLMIHQSINRSLYGSTIKLSIYRSINVSH